MQRNFKKEYEFLTKTHKKLFKYRIKQFFIFSSDVYFYRIINGEIKLNGIQEQYILQELDYFHDIQRRCGKAFLEIDIENEKFPELENSLNS
jgi:hypothetical protein